MSVPVLESQVRIGPRRSPCWSLTSYHSLVCGHRRLNASDRASVDYSEHSDRADALSSLIIDFEDPMPVPDSDPIVNVPIVTPFDEADRVDHDALSRNVRALVGHTGCRVPRRVTDGRGMDAQRGGEAGCGEDRQGESERAAIPGGGHRLPVGHRDAPASGRIRRGRSRGRADSVSACSLTRRAVL